MRVSEKFTNFMEKYKSTAVFSPMLALCISIVGVLLLSTTVRIRCFVQRVGVFLASVGHFNPNGSAAFYELVQKPCVFPTSL